MKCFPKVTDNSILFLVRFDIKVLLTMNLGQVKHLLLMHFETVKLEDSWVPLATKSDVRGLPVIAALVITAWPCRDLTMFLGWFITPLLGEDTRSEGCYELVLERVIIDILKLS